MRPIYLTYRRWLFHFLEDAQGLLVYATKDCLLLANIEVVDAYLSPYVVQDVVLFKSFCARDARQIVQVLCSRELTRQLLA